MDDGQDKRPIRWRLRRGMRELDVLLGNWYERQWPEADAALRGQFEQLLGCEDPDIWAWVMGRAAAPSELADIIRSLRND